MAHSVLDAVNNQFEKRQLQYIAPRKAIKQEQEILGTKPPQRGPWPPSSDTGLKFLEMGAPHTSFTWTMLRSTAAPGVA